MSAITTTSFRKTYNLGNYESLSIGCEMTYESGDTAEQVAEKARQELDKIYAAMVAPQNKPVEATKEQKPINEPQQEQKPLKTAENAPQPSQAHADTPASAPASHTKTEDGRIIVEENSNTFKKICARIKQRNNEGNPITMEEIDKYYSFASSSNRNVVSLMIQVGAE